MNDSVLFLVLRRMRAPLIVMILALLVSHPFETVAVLTLVYIIAIPVAVQRYLRFWSREKAESASTQA